MPDADLQLTQPSEYERRVNTFFDAICRDTEQAEVNDRVLSNAAAGRIASVLASVLGEDAPHIQDLAISGDPSQARPAVHEATALYDDAETPPELLNWIGWLATWTLHLQAEPTARETLPRHGDAYSAYLRLPDTQPDDAGLLDDFAQHYAGRFASITAMTAALTDIEQWRRDLTTFAQAHGIESYVSLNHDRIAAQLLDTYDVVALRESLFAFHK